MADGKQWYNTPQDGASGKNKKNMKPSNSGKKVVKPGASQASGSQSIIPGKKAVKPSGAPLASGKPSSVSSKPRSMPSGASGKQTGYYYSSRQQSKPTGSAGKPSNYVVKSQNKPGVSNLQKRPVSGQNANRQGTTPGPAKKSLFGKTSKQMAVVNKNGQGNSKGRTEPEKKTIIPQMGVSDKNGSAQTPSSAKASALAKEQQKILEHEKLKEATAQEQLKIKKHEYNRKNLSQQSAESRAIRNGILGAIVVAAALFVLAFVVHHLYDYIAEKPHFSFVTTGTVEHTIGAKALIVRDEDTISAVSSGELVTQITEGSRVAKGQELAIVVPDNMKSVVTDLRNVQSQISDVQQELILTGNVAEADIIYRNYNKNLSAILDSVRYDAMSGNLTNMSSYSSSVNVILDEREEEMSKIDFDDERISVLRSDEKVYEAQVEKYASVVTAHRPGIVSFRLDGKEDSLDYKTFLTMPASEIKNYINNSTGAITADLSVDEDSAVCRIAQNESQYLTVYLSYNDAEVSDFAVGTLHDINVRTEGISIDNCKVVRCESDSSGMLITFETARYVEDLLDRRTVDIEIVITETNGMRVSVPSLVNAEYAPKGNPCFCVYLPSGSGVGSETFTVGAIFNITITPDVKKDDDGNVIEQQNTNVAGCTVVHVEFLDDGGTIVAFSTPNDYSNLKKLDALYPQGYKSSYVDTSTGLGLNAMKIIVTDYSGIASVYVNNQGFVDEVRVLLLDNDREFAIIDQIGNSKTPNLDTVIITNPKTVKPSDKVD